MKWSFGLKALFVVATTVVLSAAMLWAQKAIPGPKYDTANEVTIKGPVEEIKLIPGVGEGMHLIVKENNESFLVHVAPETFLKEMDFPITKGVQIEVVGSKIKSDAGDEILAREINEKGNVLTLRDKKGVPIWVVWDPSKK